MYVLKIFLQVCIIVKMSIRTDFTNWSLNTSSTFLSTTLLRKVYNHTRFGPLDGSKCAEPPAEWPHSLVFWIESPPCSQARFRAGSASRMSSGLQQRSIFCSWPTRCFNRSRTFTCSLLPSHMSACPSLPAPGVPGQRVRRWVQVPLLQEGPVWDGSRVLQHSGAGVLPLHLQMLHGRVSGRLHHILLCFGCFFAASFAR